MSSSSPLSDPLPFREAGMIPQPGDSAALAKRLLPKGTRVSLDFLVDDVGASAAAPKVVTLTSPCLEGHRFAVTSLPPGSKILSWGLPFGTALVPGIEPGDVLVNSAMAKALTGRLAGHHGEENTAIRQLLDAQPVNFEDEDVSPDHPFDLDGCELGVVGHNNLRKGNEGEGGTFLGYRRPGKRGVGTRNHVAVIGLTSSAAPALLPLSDRWKNLEYVQDDDESMEVDGGKVEKNKKKQLRDDFDGVRIVAHTEGESPGTTQHNMNHIHRCMAGFLVHPNVGAAVVATTGRERHVTKETLLAFVANANAEAMAEGRDEPYPPECFDSPHCRWVRIRGGPLSASRKLDGAVEEAVRHAVSAAAGGEKRIPCPLRELSIALQCGGSDAFSGLTGNPLAGAMARHFIFAHGSRAVLAESPELVGAEPYILSRVSGEKAARDFIRTTEHYKGYAARHGQSAAGNPSGGNLYRGLYNINLKSLGAARKKPPEVALDRVLSYGEPMPSQPAAPSDEPEREGPHYAFMDSPGNDLESIAGQVSTGCNLVLFITGNGALTNFPFVPTLKIVTTSRRHALLANEMDIDAGPFGHGGDDRERCVEDAVCLAERVAGGERTKGEEAGHSQVNLWRNWAVEERSRDGGGEEKKSEHGEDDTTPEEEAGPLRLCSDNAPHVISPHPLSADGAAKSLPRDLLDAEPIRRTPVPNDGANPSTPLRPWSLGSTYSIVPTSLCSSAIAASIRDTIIADADGSLPRIACPSHTEGCGASGDAPYERTYQRLLLGHALHPSVSRALFLEHGCEKTHNDYFRNTLRECGALGGDEGEADGGENGADGVEGTFDFWSLQADGGFDNARRHVAEYFLREDETGSAGGPLRRPIFGVPWSDRPISVGFMVDPAALLGLGDEDDDKSSDAKAKSSGGGGGVELATALARAVRYLSFLGVHSVLPANSPLLSSAADVTPSVAVQKANGEESTPAAAAGAGASNGDIEDLLSPPKPKPKSASSGPPSKRRRTKLDGSARTAFLADVLGKKNNANDEGLPEPTLLPAQMIGGTSLKGETTRGGLHVMAVPKKGGATWDETASCLGVACDVLAVVAASEGEAEALPGSGLVPTARFAVPSSKGSDDDAVDDGEEGGRWTDWTTSVCRRLSEVLRSPIVSGGGEDGDREVLDREVKKLREELFTVTTFVVPRGNAVSL